jgi:hypothetical protein
MTVPKSIVSTGTTFRLFDESVQTHESLPVNTYKVQFSPAAGFTLRRIAPLSVGTPQIYGEHARKLDRIMSTYHRIERSLGVLLSGDKGMGKSLLIRMLAERAQTRLGLPVIIVDSDADGLAGFLDSLGECLVIFDEFEKVFPADLNSEHDDRQHQFLGLFDGTSATKRLYVLSVNELDLLSDYFVNRPGRFHYHIRFSYPDADDVLRYLQDEVPNADPGQVKQVVAFSRKVKLNYDHLRAIALELGAGEDFGAIIGDLNIKRVEAIRYMVTTTFADDSRVVERMSLDLFDGEVTLVAGHPSRTDVKITFPSAAVVPHGNVLKVPRNALNSSVCNYHEERATETPGLEVVAVELEVQGQLSLAY